MEIALFSFNFIRRVPGHIRRYTRNAGLESQEEEEEEAAPRGPRKSVNLVDACVEFQEPFFLTL